MRDGKVVGRLKTAETNAAELARLMVGPRRAAAGRQAAGGAGKAPFSTVRKLTVEDASGVQRRLDGVSFEVRAGEIVGIAGVEGNGQTELIEALAGLVRAPRDLGGEVEFGGEEHRADSTRGSARSAASRTSPRTATGAACCSTSTCRRTRSSACTTGRPVASAGPALWLDTRRSIARAARIIRDFDVRPPDIDAAGARALRRQPAEADHRPRVRAAARRCCWWRSRRGASTSARIEFIHRRLVALRDAGCADPAGLRRARGGDGARRPPARHARGTDRGRGRSGAHTDRRRSAC